MQRGQSKKIPGTSPGMTERESGMTKEREEGKRRYLIRFSMMGLIMPSITV